MPKISSFNIRSTEGTIDQRVQSASIDKSGAGEVARAIGNIGAQGAQLANKFLLEAKTEEASTFATSSTIEKDRARQEFTDKNRHRVDSFTGKLEDGTNWSDAISQWETNYDKELAPKAPTDMARRAFQNKDAGNKRNTILREQLWQFNQQQGKRELTLQTNTDTTAKTIQAMDSQILKDSGSNLTMETESRLLETADEIKNFNNGQFSKGQLHGDLLLKKHMNTIAVAGVNAQLRNKEYAETLDVMGVGQVIKNDAEFRAKMEQKLAKELGKKVQIIDALNNKVLKIATEVGSTKSEEYFDMSTGMPTLDMPMIGITGVQTSGEADPTKEPFKVGLILDSVTPQQQKSFIDQAISGSLATAKKNSKELLNRADNLISAMKAPLGEDGKEVYDDTVGHSFSDKVRSNIAEIASLPENIMDSTSKLNAIARVASAAVYSQNTDEGSKWTPSTTDEERINISDEAINKIISSTGVNFSPDDLRKINLQTKRELRIATAEKANKIANNPEQYILENDEDIKSDLMMAQEIEGQNINSRLAGGTALGAAKSRDMYTSIKKDIDKRYDELGVGEGSRNYFPDSVIKLDMQKIKGLEASGTGDRERLAIFLQESIDSKGDLAHNYFTKLVEKGLDPAYMLALKAPKSVNSVSMIKDISDMVSDKKLIRDKFSEIQANADIKTTIPQLAGLAQSELSPIATNFASSGNYNDRRAEVDSYKEIITTKAADLMAKGETSPQVAVQKAYDLYMKEAYVEALTKKGSSFIPKRTIENLGATLDHVDALATTYTDPANLPLEKIDIIGMISPVEKKKIADSIKSSRPEGFKVTNSDIEKIATKNFVEERYGDINLQDNGDNFYLTITPLTGVIGQSQVVKLKKDKNNNSKELAIPYKDAISNPKVLDKAKELAAKKADETKTGIDKILNFFGVGNE